MVPLPRETTGKMPIPNDDELEEMKETMRNALLLKGITLDVSVEVNPFMGRDVTYKLCRYSDKASIEVYSARFRCLWRGQWKQRCVRSLSVQALQLAI
jgi:hypothetical protein